MLPSKTRCIGILTAGGDSPGLNAVVRAITKVAINIYGMRVLGKSSVLLVESGGPGRLSRLDVVGDHAKVSVLKEGFTDVPVSVAIVGTKAFVLEGQLNDLYGPPGTKPAGHPFQATAVELQAGD